jgi:hypothetical protein
MKRLILFAALRGLLIGPRFAQRGSHAGASVRTMGLDSRTTALGPTTEGVTPHAAVKATPNAKTVDPSAATAAEARAVNPNAKAVPNARTREPLSLRRRRFRC